MDPALPPVQKLVVPASAPGNRSVSFRPTLTPGVSRTLERTPRETVRNTVLHNCVSQFCPPVCKNNLFLCFYHSPQDNYTHYLIQPQAHHKGKNELNYSNQVNYAYGYLAALCFLNFISINLFYPSTSTMSSSGPVYPLSSTPAASSSNSGGGKMKRERTSARPTSKRPEEDEVTTAD